MKRNEATDYRQLLERQIDLTAEVPTPALACTLPALDLCVPCADCALLWPKRPARARRCPPQAAWKLRERRHSGQRASHARAPARPPLADLPSSHEPLAE